MKQNSFYFYYYRFKDSPYYSLTLVVGVVLVCLVLIFQVIVPQLQSWFSIRDEVMATTDRINTINQNINFMNNVDKSKLNNDLKVATNALPSEKDLGAILQALSEASVKSGVSFDDFTFQVGNIGSGSATIDEKPSVKELSAIKLTVIVSGSVESVQQFLKAINEKLPLSEIVSVDGDPQATSITLQFYQKQFPSLTIRDDRPLTGLSDKDVALLQKLSKWQTMPVKDAIQTATSSGVPLF